MTLRFIQAFRLAANNRKGSSTSADMMTLRDLVGDATLAVLAARTPLPVPTYCLAPLERPVARTAPALARVGEIEIEYDIFGDPGDPPLLLVMGLAGQRIAWDEEFCARLAACGFRVIRFDNRDIGRSTWLNHEPVPNLLRLLRARRRGEALRVPYLLSDMADDALGLLDALEVPSAHLLGASMGGMIAQTMALRAPERVRTLTSVMSSTGERDLPHPHWRAMGVLLVPAPRERAAYMRRAIRVWRILSGMHIPLDLARTRAKAELAYRRGLNPAGVARQLAAILASPSRAEALRSLSVPTLVLHGDADPLVLVEGGRRTAAAIPGADLEVIPGMGHTLPPLLWERLIDRLVLHTTRGEAAPASAGVRSAAR